MHHHLRANPLSCEMVELCETTENSLLEKSDLFP